MQAFGHGRASEFQRLSLTIQRLNAVLLKGSFVSLPDMD
jgi:hypothetical protein